MRQSELCREISRRVLVKPLLVRKCLETLSDILKSTVLVDGQEVATPFGKFNRKVIPSRKCRNPRTGTSYVTDETHALAFSTRKKLKLHKMEDGTFAPIPPRKRKSVKSR